MVEDRKFSRITHQISKWQQHNPIIIINIYNINNINNNTTEKQTDLLHDGCCDEGVLEDVLTKVLVEHQTLLDLLVHARFLLALYLPHLLGTCASHKLLDEMKEGPKRTPILSEPRVGHCVVLYR